MESYAKTGSRPYTITSWYRLNDEICNNVTEYNYIYLSTTWHRQLHSRLVTQKRFINFSNRRLVHNPCDCKPIVNVYVNEWNCHHSDIQWISRRQHHRSLEMSQVFLPSTGRSAHGCLDTRGSRLATATAIDLSHLTFAGRSIPHIRRKVRFFVSGRSERFSVNFDEHPVSLHVRTVDDDGSFARRSSVLRSSTCCCRRCRRWTSGDRGSVFRLPFASRWSVDSMTTGLP